MPIPERGLMLGRGLAAVGLTVGTVEVLSAGGTSTDQTSATSVAGQDVAPATNDATASEATSRTEGSTSTAAPVVEPQAGTAPGNGDSTLLIVIAICAALGAAVLGWFGWRSR